jgi:hypothetical protein
MDEEEGKCGNLGIWMGQRPLNDRPVRICDRRQFDREGGKVKVVGEVGANGIGDVWFGWQCECVNARNLK